MAMLTMVDGPSTARRFGDLHENVKDNSSALMAYYNNELGIRLGLKMRSLRGSQRSPSVLMTLALRLACTTAMVQGSLRVAEEAHQERICMWWGY